MEYTLKKEEKTNWSNNQLQETYFNVFLFTEDGVIKKMLIFWGTLFKGHRVI